MRFSSSGATLISHSPSATSCSNTAKGENMFRPSGVAPLSIKCPLENLAGDLYKLRADIESVYGEKFVAPLTAPPIYAFVADGSFVTLYRRAGSEEAGSFP